MRQGNLHGRRLSADAQQAQPQDALLAGFPRVVAAELGRGRVTIQRRAVLALPAMGFDEVALVQQGIELIESGRANLDLNAAELFGPPPGTAEIRAAA